MKNTLVKTTRVAQQIGLRKPRPGEVGLQPIWLAQGGSEDDAGGDDAPNDGDTDEDNDNDEGDSDESADDTTKKSKTVSQAEFERVKLHLSKADQKKAKAEERAARAEQELAELKAKDLPDAEKVKLEHDKIVAERDTYKSKWTGLARTNAFLLASEAAKVSWVNSSVAMKAGDLEDLEIEEDGTVPGMTEAIKQLAKDHPYLLAPKDSTSTKETPPKSGSVVGSTKKGTKTEQEISDEELYRRMPSLRR